MVNETAWFKFLLTLNSPDAISAEIVKEIEAKNKLPFELFAFYGLDPETITQEDYENLCTKLYKINHK